MVTALSETTRSAQKGAVAKALTFCGAGLLVALLFGMLAIAKPANALTPTCTDSLRAKIAAAPSGGTVVADPCIYREKVIVNKPLILKGQPGSEIRGSDVWTDWTNSGPYWLSESTLPSFPVSVKCPTATGRCHWPEQVFFDGEPLYQVASDPKPGQFAVDADRRVVLADDPSGHTVEVTTRRQWVVGGAGGVSIEGFTMKHAASGSQRNGGLTNNGYSDWTVQNNVLSDAHTSVVSLVEADDLWLEGNDISRGGQLGVHGGAAALMMNDNKIHHNNTEDFHKWRIGGAKTSGMKSLTADGNEVYANNGVGLWSDVASANVVYSNNRVHHNRDQGILFEVSSGANIFGNVLWENGWGVASWGWGGGIVSSSSKDVEVYDNTVAWNADGISVISQNRKGTENDAVTNVYVHDNTILAKDYPNTGQNYALSWLQDWADGVLFVPTSNNRGENNRYWYSSPEGAYVRYKYAKVNYKKLADFNATLGEEGGRYLSDAEKDEVVSAKGVPASPEPH